MICFNFKELFNLVLFHHKCTVSETIALYCALTLSTLHASLFCDFQIDMNTIENFNQLLLTCHHN